MVSDEFQPPVDHFEDEDLDADSDESGQQYSLASGSGITTGELPRTGSSSDESSLARTSEPASDVEESVRKEPVEIELTEGNCPLLMTTMQRNLGLTVASGLKKASALILATPTRIEIVLENTADFARKVLDAPDNRAKIEAEILRLTGKVVAVGLRLIAPEVAAEIPQVAVPAAANVSRPTASKPAEPSRSTPTRVPEPQPATNLLGAIDPSKDPFVRKVMETFGATVVKVTAAPAVQVAAAGEDSES
jgi:hypothetical protein